MIGKLELLLKNLCVFRVVTHLIIVSYYSELS